MVKGGNHWRTLSGSEFGLSAAISDHLSASVGDDRIANLRSADSLLMFSDYGGAHKQARYEIISFLALTLPGLRSFDDERRRLREGSMGSERRMSYKALNDTMRMRSLPSFLTAADQLQGLLISFALDKRSMGRMSERYAAAAAFGELGRWAEGSFGKLTRIGHLGAIIVEGVRREGQDLIWISDQDEIAPNDAKHVEATRVLGHYLNSYCTGNMGHFRFGTTASDAGDLLIEDLAAVPDLAAGCLGDVLSRWAPHPESSSVNRVFVPAGGDFPIKTVEIASWLAASSAALGKLCVVVDEGRAGCSVRSFETVTRLEEL